MLKRSGGCGRRGLRGFLLVEILLGIGLLIISGIWLLASYHSALELCKSAEQIAIALDDIKDMAERIKVTPFSQLTVVFPNGVANGGAPNPYGAVVGGYTLPSEQITVTHQPNTGADPRELVVQLSWTQGGRTYQRSVSTLRSSQAS